MKKFYTKLHLSNECNLRCYYCTIHKDDVKIVDIKKLENFFERNKNYFRSHVKVLGGEPTVFITEDHIKLILRYFKTINFTSNFTNPDFIEKYWNYENISYLASYNGPEDDKHKTNGEILKRIKKYKARIEAVSMVINKKTIKYLPEIAKFCYDEDVKLITIPEVQYKVIQPNDMITPEEWSDVFDQLKKDGSYVVMKSLQEHLNFSYYDDSCKYCSITVDWNNKVKPCSLQTDLFDDQFKDNVFGDLENVDLGNLNYDCINKRIHRGRIISYDGTECLKCNKCNFLCEVDEFLGGGRSSAIKCEYGRWLWKFFHSDPIISIRLQRWVDMNVDNEFKYKPIKSIDEINSMVAEVNEIMQTNLMLESQNKLLEKVLNKVKDTAEEAIEIHDKIENVIGVR